MSEAAVWYLVVQMASSLISPMTIQPPMVGPITAAQCQQTKAALGGLPDVVSARCRKAVGMMAISEGPISYARPIFEGDLSVSVGSVR